VICEEAWYDSVSILDSADSEDDDLDNDFASVSGGKMFFFRHCQKCQVIQCSFRVFSDSSKAFSRLVFQPRSSPGCHRDGDVDVDELARRRASPEEHRERRGMPG
jgi:hypothetical protein